MERLSALEARMISFERGNPHQIQHSVKVHAFAKMIGEAEGLRADALETLEAAAILHDVGIRVAREKYGRTDGPLQEKEGPAPARALMAGLGFPAETVERVCALVGEHHTTVRVDGLDHRILLEADFLVNAFEERMGGEAIRRAREAFFRTEAGLRLLGEMYPEYVS